MTSPKSLTNCFNIPCTIRPPEYEWLCPKCSSPPCVEVTVGLDGGSKVCSGVVQKGRKHAPCNTHFHWCAMEGKCIEGSPLHERSPPLDQQSFIRDANLLNDQYTDYFHVMDFVIKYNEFITKQCPNLAYPKHHEDFDPVNRFIHRYNEMVSLIQVISNKFQKEQCYWQ
jgi:hypothetical protein